MNANILLFLLFSFAANSQTYNGKIIRIIDGDTVEAIIEDKKVKIRVEGIDCPEYNQDFGLEATQYTYFFCFNQDVLITKKEFDRYGRLVASIKLLDSLDLSECLLIEGYAWHYKKYDRSIKLAELEDTAKIQQVGIWSLPNPVSPWCYRNPNNCRN